MKRYKSKFTKKLEGFEKKTDAEKSQEVKDAIAMLKDESFGSDEQRKKLAKAMYKIVGSKEVEAKSFVKELGKVMSNWSDGNFNKGEED